MPVTKSAKKKLRKDKKREADNKRVKSLLVKLIKQAAKNPTTENVRKAVKTLDLSAKKKIIHANKAARIKSKLSKIAKPANKAKTTTKTVKKSAPKKKSAKK